MRHTGKSIYLVVNRWKQKYTRIRTPLLRLQKFLRVRQEELFDAVGQDERRERAPVLRDRARPAAVVVCQVHRHARDGRVGVVHARGLNELPQDGTVARVQEDIDGAAACAPVSVLSKIK